MKKFLPIILVIFLFIGLVGCNSAPNIDDENMDEYTQNSNSNNNLNDESSYYKEDTIETFNKLNETLVAVNDLDVFITRMTFYFENDKAVNAIVEVVYEDDKYANSMYKTFLNDNSYANVSIDGSIVTYTFSHSGFELYKDKSKLEISEILQETNFTIQ